MTYAIEFYEGNGSTREYSVPFPYLSKSHVEVVVDGVPAPFSWLNDHLIQLSAPPAQNTMIQVKRVTPPTRLVDFTDGSTLTETDLDTSAFQALFLSQEALDRANLSVNLTPLGTMSAQNHRITDVSDPVKPQDAVTKKWAETGMTSQLVLATSKANEATSKANEAATAASAAQAAKTAALQAAEDAVEAASGLVLATNADALAGLSAAKIMSPAAVAYRDAASGDFNIYRLGAGGANATNDLPFLESLRNAADAFGSSKGVPGGGFQLPIGDFAVGSRLHLYASNRWRRVSGGGKYQSIIRTYHPTDVVAIADAGAPSGTFQDVPMSLSDVSLFGAPTNSHCLYVRTIGGFALERVLFAGAGIGVHYINSFAPVQRDTEFVNIAGPAIYSGDQSPNGMLLSGVKMFNCGREHNSFAVNLEGGGVGINFHQLHSEGCHGVVRLVDTSAVVFNGGYFEMPGDDDSGQFFAWGGTNHGVTLQGLSFAHGTCSLDHIVGGSLDGCYFYEANLTFGPNCYDFDLGCVHLVGNSTITNSPPLWPVNLLFNWSKSNFPDLLKIGYRRSARQNRVFLGGAVVAGSGSTGNPIFSLPLGYRPRTQPQYVVGTVTDSEGNVITPAAVVKVDPNGNVVLLPSIAAGHILHVSCSFELT